MKKFTLTVLIGLSLGSVAHALKDGDRLKCGKIYYNSGLRGDTKTNFATVKNAANRTQSISNGQGVHRTN